MKVTASPLLIGLFSFVDAFPFIAELASDSLARRTTEPRQLVTPPYDAAQQYVSNTGAHAFNPPSGDDKRGPCPGLNAMANHGYFPHNGIGSYGDFINGCFEAFGMGQDLGGFLAVYGAIFDGNLVEYSIGGPDPSVLNLGGLLGEPMGLAGSHNKYEGDVSPVRGDLFVYGNDYLNQVSQFNGLVELAMQNNGLVDLPLLTKYRAERFQQSISGNPYFFNAPFSGVIASPAAWTFIYRFMANHTAEHPEGILDIDILKSFYSMTGDYPNFTYTPGHEKFPDYWYRRNDLDAYTIPYFLSDAVAMAVAHPEFISLGGNTGTVNSFVGIEPADLTMGVFDGATLLQDNKLFCYALEVSFMEAPDFLSGLFTDINPAMDMLGSAINNFTHGFICPKLNEIDKGQFSKYPGFADLKPDGTY